jgi:hypothetical protein
MSKVKEAVLGDGVIRPMADARSWARSNGTYIAGRAYLDEADQTAADMEAKWGADRLRRLVDPDLREKFDRQRYLLNQAIWHGELEAVRREAMRMVKAWYALDAAATAGGKQALDPKVWEIALEDGTVAAIVPDNDHAYAVLADGRQVVVYTIEEIARLLSQYPEIAKIKLAVAGATVTQVRRSVDDPLGAVHDSALPIDEEIGF